MKLANTNFRLILLVAAMGSSGLPVGTVSAADTETGVWAIFSTTDFLPSEESNPQWQYSFDAQARYVDIGSGTNQWLARPALGYRFSNGVNIWAGYARLESRNASGRRSSENRYWQQVDWRVGELADGRMTMRVRIEERSVDTGDDVRLVARFMTKFVRPFKSDPNMSLVLSLEPFVDLNDTDWGGESGLGQNRTNVGLAWKISQKLTLEAAYMNQYIFADQGPDRVNHLAVLNFKTKF